MLGGSLRHYDTICFTFPMTKHYAVDLPKKLSGGGTANTTIIPQLYLGEQEQNTVG